MERDPYLSLTHLDINWTFVFCSVGFIVESHNIKICPEGLIENSRLLPLNLDREESGWLSKGLTISSLNSFLSTFAHCGFVLLFRLSERKIAFI